MGKMKIEKVFNGEDIYLYDFINYPDCSKLKQELLKAVSPVNDNSIHRVFYYFKDLYITFLDNIHKQGYYDDIKFCEEFLNNEYFLSFDFALEVFNTREILPFFLFAHLAHLIDNDISVFAEWDDENQYYVYYVSIGKKDYKVYY